MCAKRCNIYAKFLHFAITYIIIILQSLNCYEHFYMLHTTIHKFKEIKCERYGYGTKETIEMSVAKRRNTKNAANINDFWTVYCEKGNESEFANFLDSIKEIMRKIGASFAIPQLNGLWSGCSILFGFFFPWILLSLCSFDYFSYLDKRYQWDRRM